jgi:hypothetical protein
MKAKAQKKAAAKPVREIPFSLEDELQTLEYEVSVVESLATAAVEVLKRPGGSAKTRERRLVDLAREIARAASTAFETATAITRARAFTSCGAGTPNTDDSG